MPIDPNSLEKVHLFLSASQLTNVQMMSKSDPFAVLYLKDFKTHQLEKIGSTELIMDNVSPTWATSFTVDYMFEVCQEFVVKVFHCHDHKHPISDESKHTPLGETSFLLSNLMRSSGGRLELDIDGAKRHGKLFVRGEAVANTRDLFVVTFAGHKLANKDGFFGTSDPFMEISRCNEDSSYTVVWKSSKIDNTLSPHWGETKIPMASLCNGDLDRPLRIQIWDWDSNGKHQSMGIVSTSVRSMLTRGTDMEVIEADKQAKTKGYTNSGHVNATNVRIEHYPTFSEFIQGGCEINLVVAVDFTASNGDPNDPQSLHFIDPSGKMNPYQTAISAVGSVLSQYDTDKKYAVFGFGARLKEAGGSGFTTVQHCFPVYGGGAEVSGLEGVLNAYKDCVKAVMFSGPTLFGPLMGGANYIAQASNCSQSQQKYTILLVLTDGTFEDQDATKDMIIAGSNLPLSIIFIGIGPANFGELSVLDSDKTLLKRGSQAAVRDIVQFVPYSKVSAYGSSVLAQQVLAEIPNQVLKYFEQHNILPNKR